MNVARSITVLPILMGLASGLTLLQQIPDLDTSSAVSVLGWALVVAVIGIGGLFSLMWRFVTKNIDGRLEKIETRQYRLLQAFLKAGVELPPDPDEE